MFDVDTARLKYDIDQKLKGYSINVGIITDRYASVPAQERIKDFYGGPALKKSGKKSNETLRQILAKFDGFYNLLLGPWLKAENKDCVAMVNAMIDDMNKSDADKSRFLNAAQAVVRNPILRQEYGANTRVTEHIKGFNRLLISTGTLFDNIKASLTRKV